MKKNKYNVEFYATNEGVNRATIRRNSKPYMDIPASDAENTICMITAEDPTADIEGYHTFTLADYARDYQKTKAEAEKCKCCENCNYCTESYGYIECTKEEMPEDADTKSFYCSKWQFGY